MADDGSVPTIAELSRNVDRLVQVVTSLTDEIRRDYVRSDTQAERERRHEENHASIREDVKALEDRQKAQDTAAAAGRRQLTVTVAAGVILAVVAVLFSLSGLTP